MEARIALIKGVLTVPEAASFLNCSSQKIYTLIKLNKIEAYKDISANGTVGRDWKITAQSLIHYQNSQMLKKSQEEVSDDEFFNFDLL